MKFAKEAREKAMAFLPVAPVMTVPAMMTPTPVAVTPTPMAVVPTPVAMVVPSPMVAMSPSNLLRLKVFDFLIRRHGWLGILTRLIFIWQLRKQRSRLRSRGKRGTGCKSNSEFQKLSAFHASLLCRFAHDAERVSPGRSEQRLN